MSPEPRPALARVRAAVVALPLLALALAFAACGGDDDEPAGAGDASPAALAPADAAVYAEALIQPDGELEDEIVTAARRVTLLDDPFGDLRRELDEQADGESGFFSREVEPWLGERLGVFVLPAASDPQLDDPDVGLIAAVRDRDEAQDMLARLREDGDTRRGGSYEGVGYDVDDDGETVAGLVEDRLVLGTLPAFRAAVDTADGAGLASSDRYADAVEAVADDALAFAWVDPEPFLPALTAQADLADPAVRRIVDQLRQARPATLSLTARADELALEISADESSVPPTDGDGEVSVGALPGDAWAVLATPPLGEAIRTQLQQSGEYDAVARQLRAAAGLDLDRDVLGWLGGVAAFVRGTAPLQLGGGLVIGSADAAASRRLVDRLEQMVGAFGAPVRPLAGETGFQVTVSGSPQPIAVIARDDRVAIGFGAPSARDGLEPDETFADSEDGQAVLDTLGAGYEPSFALVLDPLLQLLRAVGADRDPEVRQALPYLSAYRSIAAGTKRDDERVTVRVVAGLQEPTP